MLLCVLYAPTTEGQSGKNVLFLFSAVKYSDEMLNVVEPWMRTHFPENITFYDAYVDDPQVEEKSYRESLSETLHRRYAALKMDVVVACNPAAIHFATEYRDKLFPGVPIVFVGISNSEFDDQKMPPNITGVVSSLAFRETIDLALRLQPDTKAVAIVAGATNWDSYHLAHLHSELVRYQDKVKEMDLIGPADYQMLERVAALPPHTVVMFQVYPQFSDRPNFGTWDLLTATAQRVPTYSAFPRLCINGCIGGVYEDHLKLWTMTADMAVRVLSGVRPENIPVVYNTGVHVQVDWRPLQRWHIPESALPPDTQVLYRESTLWERGRKYFLGGIAVIVLQSLLIFALFRQRARRRKAEIELRKSEEKFSKVFRRSPLAITMVNASDDRYVDVNETFELHTGWKRDEVIGRNPLEINLWVDPDQRTSFMTQLLAEGKVADLEVKFRRKNGDIRTGLGSTELIEVNGERCALSVIADITERKMAEEALSGFSRRLIEAQEKERTRIARELHDDIIQRLALVAVTLKTLDQSLPAFEAQARLGLQEACTKISDLANDIQGLSHRLHSSKLEYLGLATAARSFCKELSARHSVKIDFKCDSLPEDLSGEVSLCIFRVLQEALHNAVKYSGVGEFEVSLIGTFNEVQLRVHDSGAGFDPKIASNGQGLGLTSMKERLRLVNGQLSIDSRPHQGTTVFGRVPLAEGVSAGAVA